MDPRELPHIGAAMPVRLLEQHRDWLLEGQRDLEIQDAFHPDFLDGDWRAQAQVARKALQGHTGRVGIHGPFVGYTLQCGFDRLLAEAVSTRLGQALDFSAEIGATHMVIHSPFHFFGQNTFAYNLRGTGKSFPDELSLVHRLLDPLVKKAGAQDCCLVIENIHDTNPQPLLELVRSFDSPHVRMSLDVGHAFITQQWGGPSPDLWVHRAGDLLAHVHVQDTDGQTDRHWAPGEGNVNWFALFEALATLDQAPRLLLELRNHQSIRQAAGYLASRGFVR